MAMRRPRRLRPVGVPTHGWLSLTLSVCLLAGLTSCGTRTERELVVLAAASLAEVFAELAADYEAQSGVTVRTSFAGSQVLAAQLEAGIRAHVIAVANGQVMRRLETGGRVDRPVRFATNRLVWVTRRDAPAFDPEDLAELDRRVVLAAPEVPAGDYARRALAQLGVLDALQTRLVSHELDVRGVVSKLLLAGADAGITYATDIGADERDRLRVQPLAVDVRASYLIATVARTVAHAVDADGRAFVEFVRGPHGQARLAEAGFGPP